MFDCDLDQGRTLVHRLPASYSSVLRKISLGKGHYSGEAMETSCIISTSISGVHDSHPSLSALGDALFCVEALPG